MKYVYFSLLFIGIGLIFYAYKYWDKKRDLLKNGLQTEAKVVNLIRVRSNNGFLFKPVLEYANRTGELVQFTSKVSSNPPAYQLSQSVSIVVYKNEVNIISYWELYLVSIILLCLSMPAVIIGGGYLLFHYY